MNSFLKIIFASFSLIFTLTVNAQQIPGRPLPPRLVNDFTNTLTSDQIQSLENKLVAFSDSTSNQIAVVIVETTGDYEASEYALKIGREWGVGSKEFNNGVILLVAKKDRRINISPGYGLEGALPDITAKHIIEDVITPNFRGDDYYRGIYLGTDAIIKSIRGEYTAPAKRKQGRSSKFPFLIIIIILFLLFSGGGRGGKGGQFMSRRGSRGLAGPLIWGSLLGGAGGGGGGGFGGGSSGGGFGGFGGGSFGGGGASGSW